MEPFLELTKWHGPAEAFKRLTVTEKAWFDKCDKRPELDRLHQRLYASVQRIWRPKPPNGEASVPNGAISS